MASSGKLVSVDFEVHGRVQGVFFRARSQDKATELSVVGWVMNTSYGSVAGTIQGAEEDIAKMKEWLEKEGSPAAEIEKAEFTNERAIEQLEKHWLEHTGSPKSRIERCEFKNEETLEQMKYNEFEIVRHKRKKKIVRTVKKS